MLEIKNRSYYIDIFDNISEVAKYVSNRPRKPGRRNDSEEQGYGFYGTRNFDEAINLLKYGDEKIYNDLKLERKKININKIIGANNQRLKYHNRFYGSVPNVPAFLKGNPVNMINAEKNQPKNRILNIFLNIRVGGGVDKEEIIRNGSKYLAIIDILEKNGYRCNLYSGCANDTTYNHHTYLLVRIKTDKEPLNLKKICFTIANPSMQRRIKFRWMEVNDCEYDVTRDGYGQQDDPEHTKMVLDKALRDNFIVWTYENGVKSKSVEKLLEDLERKYGIKIGE